MSKDQYQLEFATTIVQKSTTVYHLDWHKKGIEFLISSFFLVYLLLLLQLVAHCHIKFQSIPSLMPFTNPEFYYLEMSLSNILMIGLLKQQDGNFF